MNHDIREALHNLLSVMEMQEKRQSGEFHISGETFMGMWSDAKHNAREALAALDREGAGVSLPADRVQIPENRKQAEAMVVVGQAWLDQNKVATPPAAENVALTIHERIDVLNMQREQRIRDKLIALGWTPPPAAQNSACPDAARMKPYDCADRHQCWEPCGELGKSEENAKPALREAPCDSPMAPAAALTERHESEPGGKNERPLPEGSQDASQSVLLRENEILKGHLALLLDRLYDPDAIQLIRLRFVRAELKRAGIVVAR